MILFPPQIVLSGSTNITFGTTRFTVTASGAGGAAGGGIALGAGTQTATSGTVLMADSNGVTFGMSGSTRITASHDGVRSVSAGTTSGGGSVLKFADSNNVSFGWNAGTITATITVPAQTQFVLSASNGLAWGTNGSTVTGSYTQGAGATATGNLGAIAGGTQTATSGTILFSDSNGLSFGMSASTRITMSYDGVRSISAGASSGSFTGLTFANGSGVTFGLSAGTLTASVAAAGAATLRSAFWFDPEGNTNVTQQTNASMSVHAFLLPFDLSFSRIDVPVFISYATSAAANTADLNISSGAVIYSINGSTLNPIVGQLATTTYTRASNTGVYLSQTGGRLFSWALATSLSAGNYYLGLFLSTTNNSSIGTATTLLGNSISMMVGSSWAQSFIAPMNAATGESLAPEARGLISSVLTATAQTLQLSQISMTGASGNRANLFFGLRNV